MSVIQFQVQTVFIDIKKVKLSNKIQMFFHEKIAPGVGATQILIFLL